LEFGFRLVHAMREGRPASLSLLRSRPPLVRTVACAAGCFGVRTVDINPTSLSPWIGHRRPLGDWIAVPDRRGVALLSEQFGLESARIVPVGSARLASIIGSLRDETKTSARQQLGLPPVPARVVLFCSSYGRPMLYRDLLRELTRYVQQRPDVFLLVKPHPKESAEEIRGYGDVLAHTAMTDSRILPGGAGTYPAVVAADVVVTAFSTVAFEACVLGTPVIAFTGELDSSMPTEHVMSDMPEILDEIGMIGEVLEEILDRGPAFERWRTRRNAYLSDNPEMADTAVAERLARLITGPDAAAPVPGITR
jgi:CDP-glycerol glycerophosphotransferase (TagB/SpsB family)